MFREQQNLLIPFAALEELKQKLKLRSNAPKTADVPFAREWDSSFPYGHHALQVNSDGSSVPLNVLWEAVRVFSESDADTVVSLSEEGEETEEFTVYRDTFLSRYGPSPERDRSRCFPFVVIGERPSLGKGKQVEEAEEYRDRIGDRLTNPDGVDPEMRHLIKDDIQRVNRVLSLPFGKKLLDVGCSDGTVTLMAAEKWDCEEVIGADIARSAVEEALSKVCQRHMQRRVKFVASFIEDLDYPDNTFDTICATETLEHVAPGQFDSCLRNLVRMVKPAGNLIVTVPNRYPDSSYVAQKRDRWRWPAHHHFFSRLSLSYILGEFFSRIEFFPHDDVIPPEKGVYLICCCWEKK